MLYTAEHPERVERIIIVDIGPEPSPDAAADRATRPPHANGVSQPGCRDSMDAGGQTRGRVTRGFARTLKTR